MLLPATAVSLTSHVADRCSQAGLVDLDVTIAFQAFFFLLLVIVLPKLVFKPLVARIEEREARTEGARAEAKRVRHEADEQVTQYETRTAQAKRDALDERAKVRADAQRKATAVVAEAREQSAARIDAGLQSQRAQAAQARTQLNTEAAALSAQIARKLVEG